MKILVFAALAFFGFCAAQTIAPLSHNAFWGYRGLYDKLLVRETVHQSFGFFRSVSQTYEYPPKGHYNYFDITAVRVIDNYKDGDGGFATLVNGGPGQRFLKLNLESQRNHGYNFTIEIYGRLNPAFM